MYRFYPSAIVSEIDLSQEEKTYIPLEGHV